MPFLTGTYDDISIAPLIEGQISETTNWEARTGYNADTAILPFGRALARGAGDDLLVLPTGAGAQFMGIAVLTPTFEKRLGFSVDADGKSGYPLKYEVAYLFEGAIGVLVENDVVQGAKASFRHTATGGQRKGVFRSGADGATTIEIPHSMFLKSGVAGSIVPLLLHSRV